MAIKPNIKLLGLSLLSAMLLILAWPGQNFTFLLFFALCPLLLIEHILSKTNKSYGWKFIGLCYLSFIIWNAVNTYWLCFATPEGGIAAIVLNALLMCTPMFLFYRTKRALGLNPGYAGLIFYWLSFEYLHLNWELSWSWLTLGNGLSEIPNLIQWYEFTGVLGGSLWVWLINIMLFFSITALFEKSHKKALKPAGIGFILFCLPGILSFMLKPDFNKHDTVEVVVVQPNIDPYFEKYGSMTYTEQVQRMISLSDSLVTKNTDVLVWPETAVLYVDIDRLNGQNLIKMIRLFLNKYPDLSLVTGIVGNRYYNSKKTATAEPYLNGRFFYDEYNGAIMIDSSLNIPCYFKSKLVPLVENLPYKSILGKMAIDLGGTVGSLGKSKERVAFRSSKVNLAPIICYESIYGSFVGEFIDKGADLLLILTNDAWWYYPENGDGQMTGSKKGYKQHFSYAKLRAIETRKSIARSANTGISGFIFPDGSIKKQTTYWEKDVIKMQLPVIKGKTFYTKHGDYLGRVSGILSIFIILVMLVSKYTEQYKFRKNAPNGS